MKRTTLALAAVLAIGTAAAGTTGSATAAEKLTVTAPNAAGVQLAAGYGYGRYRFVPRRYVRIQLRRRGYYRIHNIRLIRRYTRPGYVNGYRYRPRVRAFYIAHAYKFGRKFRIYVNAYNGRPYRRVRIW